MGDNIFFKFFMMINILGVDVAIPISMSKKHIYYYKNEKQSKKLFKVPLKININQK